MMMWKWVPVDPTEEQFEAIEKTGIMWNDNNSTDVYQAMVLAAPSPFPIEIPRAAVSEEACEVAIRSLKDSQSMEGRTRIRLMVEAICIQMEKEKEAQS